MSDELRVTRRWRHLANLIIQRLKKQVTWLFILPLLISLVSTSAAFIVNVEVSRRLEAALTRDLFRDILAVVALLIAILQLALAVREHRRRPDPLLQLRKLIKAAYSEAIRTTERQVGSE